MTRVSQQLAAELAPPSPGAPGPAARSPDGRPVLAGALLFPLRWLGLCLQLAKARLSALVVVTTAVGFVMASPGAPGAIDWPLMLWTLLGTSLAAAAANALNQVIEAERDARMPRTRNRPLPSGRMSPMHAVALAVPAAGMGVTILAAMVNVVAAGLCLLTIVLYLGLYTPLKTRSTLNTLAGAVVGAIPPMIGWTAAAGRLEPGAWVLAATLFVWQVPHFLALAWMYRRDYAMGGYRMLPMMDPSGAITGRAVVLWSLALLPVTLTASWVGMAGPVFAVGAIALAALLIHPAARLYQDRTVERARKLFLATLIYLPLLMGWMVLHRAAADAPADPAPILYFEPSAEPGRGPTVIPAATP